MDQALTPWERRPEEPNKWFDRFERFKLLGSARSLFAAYTADRARRGRETSARTGVPLSWRYAADHWEWKDRAEAWDEAQRQEQSTEWRRRRDELREQEWKMSQDLLDKARQMLVFPLAKTTRSQQDEGMTMITEVHPTRWSIADAGRLSEAASKLGRLALGEETERVGLTAHLIDVTADDLANAAREVANWEQDIYGADLSADISNAEPS